VRRGREGGEGGKGREENNIEEINTKRTI